MELKIEKNKYSPAELALLGIFAFGLLLSLLLVSSRKKIPFSQPFIAPFDGLKISMPSGRGWQVYGGWRFSDQDNCFILESILRDNNRDIAIVRWQYYAAPEEKALDEVIRQKIAEGGYAKVRTGNIESDGMDFTTMIFTSPVSNSTTGTEDSYYAICKLPFSRQLTIEVRTAGDSELAERSFNAAIKGLKYSVDSRLTAGKAFVKKLKTAGADDLIRRETDSTFRRVFLVEKTDPANTFRRNIGVSNYSGFTVELFSRVKDLNGRPGINTLALYFIDGSKGWVARSHFDCDKSFDKFFWPTKQSSLSSRVGSDTVLEYEDGVLQYNNRNYALSALSLPEIFFDSAAAVFLDDGDEKVVIDLILPDGRVIPTEISKIDSRKNLSKTALDDVVRFTLYNAAENYYEVLFDKDGNIAGKTEKTSRTLRLKKTDIKEVIDSFGQWKNDIEEMLKNG